MIINVIIEHDALSGQYHVILDVADTITLVDSFLTRAEAVKFAQNFVLIKPKD